MNDFAEASENPTQTFDDYLDETIQNLKRLLSSYWSDEGIDDRVEDIIRDATISPFNTPLRDVHTSICCVGSPGEIGLHTYVQIPREAQRHLHPFLKFGHRPDVRDFFPFGDYNGRDFSFVLDINETTEARWRNNLDRLNSALCHFQQIAYRFNDRLRREIHEAGEERKRQIREDEDFVKTLSYSG